MSVPQVQTLLWGFIVVMNLVAFALFGIDKQNSVRGRRRVSETCLMTVAILFASAGTLLGMLFFRHKIRKKKFAVTVPLLLLLQASVLWILQMGL